MKRINLDISNRFGKLFTVKFQHDYYREGKCRDLQIEPLQETKVLMQRYGLMFRQVDQEFWLGYREGKRLKVLLDVETEPLRFSFMVKSRNPLFFNFSDIPFLREGEVLYASNNKVSKKEKAIFLHQGEKITGESKLHYMPKQFEYRLAEQQEKATVKVEDFSGNIVFEEEQVLFSLVCKIDLSEAENGPYKLFIDGKLELEFYASSAEESKPITMVEVFLRPDEGGVQLLNEEGFENPVFNLAFGARAVHWKYVLTLPAKGKYEKFNVEEKDKQLRFGDPVETKLNGRSALVFKSKDTSSLQETPDKQVHLKFNKIGGQAAKFNLLLPGPSAEIIAPNETGAFDSAIYINI